MLEHFSNQASGLLGWANRPGPRLLAVVNHGDDQAELPLLWQLCLALVHFGYSVSVLDASTPESSDNPGLAQLLDNSHWHDEPVRDVPAWTVLPSANGLQSLCTAAPANDHCLQQLGQLFGTDGVVILYCKAEWMASLLAHCRIEPLLAVSPLRTSLMTGYIALKRLLISGKLKPTIVNMVHNMDAQGVAFASAASLGLRECAEKFLGQDIKSLDIAVQRGESPPNADFQRLALRLLEGALELQAATAPHKSLGRTQPMGTAFQHGEMH